MSRVQRALGPFLRPHTVATDGVDRGKGFERQRDAWDEFVHGSRALVAEEELRRNHRGGSDQRHGGGGRVDSGRGQRRSW